LVEEEEVLKKCLESESRKKRGERDSREAWRFVGMIFGGTG